jgi:cell wall-associated NlpC family hydrolase
MAKMNWSCFLKAMGVLFLLALIIVLPTVGHAAENEPQSNDEVVELLGRIPGLKRGTPFVPVLATNLEPGEFIINLVAYEQKVFVDDKFACIISYAYSTNSPSAAKNAKITLNLSKEIQYVDFYDQDLNQLDVNILRSPDGQTNVTFNLGSSIKSGSLGNIIAVAKFNSEILTPTDTPFCSATIDAENADTVSTGDVKIKPIFNPADWMIMAYKEFPTVTPPAGGEVSYGITLYGNSLNNGLDLKDVAVEIDYPKDATIIDNGGGEVDLVKGKITWQLPFLLVDDLVEKSVTLHYPSEHFTDEDGGITGKSSIAEIAAKATGTVVGIESTYNVEDYFEHDFDALTVKLGDVKAGTSFSKNEYTVDEVSNYVINGVENRGNINFKNIFITYDVPEKLQLQNVETGKFNMDVKIVLYYKTANNTAWREWAEVSALTSTKLHASSLGISDRITKIRWIISEGNEKIRPGFTARDTLHIESNVKGSFGDEVDVDIVIKAEAETTSTTTTYASATSSDDFIIMPIIPDNLSAQRRLIIENAFSLIGRVEYFWGGKSVAIGWDDRWGKIEYNATAKRYEPYGLDCSGYVEWVYANSGFSASTVINDLGVGTVYQWPNSYSVSPDDMLPGDLAFKQSSSASGTNHVGVIVGRDINGTLMVAHCSSAYNNVVVTPYAGTFYYMRRPYIMPD